MKIEAFHSFCTGLKDIHLSKQYLTFDNGDYVLTQEKNRKNLKTEDIAKIAHEAIQTASSAHFTHSEKAKLYSEISLGINDYSNRLYSQKSIWQKIAWWLGCSSVTEKELYREQKTAEKNAFDCHITCNKMKLAKDETSQKLELTEKQDTNTTFQLASYALFQKPYPDELPDGGLLASTFPKWLLGQLQEYQTRTGKKVDDAIKLLQSFLEFSILFLAREQIDKKTVVTEILAHILRLKQGEEFAFPGGYLQPDKPGHGAVCRFRKNESDSFSLTIVNTGEGALANSVHKMILDQGDLMLYKLVSHITASYPEVIDFHWKTIPLAALQEELIVLLTDPIVSPDNTCMGKIAQSITKYFSTFPQVTTGGEPSHKRQSKGSCSVKSITCWMHQCMGDALWADFKAFYSKQLFEQFQNLLPSHISDENARDRILTQGHDIIKRRLAKRDLIKI